MPLFAQPHGYGQGYYEPAVGAIAEALSWLQTQGLVVRNPVQPADWYLLTRRGRKLKNRADVAAFQKGRTLPLDLLQPALADKVRHLFLRGDYDVAVHQAFKEVEVAVRKAGQYPDDLVGKQLMRTAFHPDTGALTDKNLVLAEREAEAALFAGAIGHCKNPPSHRDVNLGQQDAARLIIFASYLLDLVAQRPA